MLRRSQCALAAGGRHPRPKVGLGDMWDRYFKGGEFPIEHRQHWPYHTFPKHPGHSPYILRGMQATKHSFSFPLIPPFSAWGFYYFPRSWLLLSFATILLDLTVGINWPWLYDREPNKMNHSWFGNNMGARHHFWCYQDGWVTPPDPTHGHGAKRMDGQ